METFVTIVIAIAIFAFQAYANYQKEQDRARRRNPAQPPLPPLPEDNAAYVKPAPAPVDPPVPSTAVEPGFERYSGVLDPQEPVRIRRPQAHPVALQRLEVDTGSDVDRKSVV